jgi:predicted dehydrogenase
MEGSKTDVVDHFLVRFAEGYLNEMRDFVQTIQTDGEPKVTGFDGRQSVAAAAAAERSYRQGQPVAVENSKR